ncbi:hypothetical protein RAS1_07560 [Phycisphaerae bacterium RAS1]|nr:hypothetical protein RAS1_07560 [Phycisphaerae bacterium RAS1]
MLTIRRSIMSALFLVLVAATGCECKQGCGPSGNGGFSFTNTCNR